jgi:mannose-6-phosphate isomerase-like protein (cupin superfamily)
MIIKSKDANQNKVGPMIIKKYNINSDFSGALIEINGDHGSLKCMKEDRIYFIIEGDGKFIIDSKENMVSANDLIFVPKETPYNIIGKLKYFLICSPEFNPKHDVFLE